MSPTLPPLFTHTSTSIHTRMPPLCWLSLAVNMLIEAFHITDRQVNNAYSVVPLWTECQVYLWQNEMRAISCALPCVLVELAFLGVLVPLSQWLRWELDRNKCDCMITSVVVGDEPFVYLSHTDFVEISSLFCYEESDWWSSPMGGWIYHTPHQPKVCPESPRQKCPDLFAYKSECAWRPLVLWPLACCLQWLREGWNRSRYTGQGSC